HPWHAAAGEQVVHHALVDGLVNAANFNLVAQCAFKYLRGATAHRVFVFKATFSYWGREATVKCRVQYLYVGPQRIIAALTFLIYAGALVAVALLNRVAALNPAAHLVVNVVKLLLPIASKAPAFFTTIGASEAVQLGLGRSQ